MCWTAASASAPAISISPMWLTSNSPARVRTAMCSSAMPVYSTGMSQPPNSTMRAPSERCLAWRGVFLSVPGGAWPSCRSAIGRRAAASHLRDPTVVTRVPRRCARARPRQLAHLDNGTMRPRMGQERGSALGPTAAFPRRSLEDRSGTDPVFADSSSNRSSDGPQGVEAHGPCAHARSDRHASSSGPGMSSPGSAVSASG